MGGWITRKPFLCHRTWTTRQDRRCPAGCSSEITNVTFRRDCHRSGKGAWIRAGQLRLLLLPPRRRRRSLVPGAPVRPELAPECLAVRLSPRKRRPAPAAFRARRSPAAAASGAKLRGPQCGMEVKGESTQAPGGGFSVSAEETEKWMEEAMQMVRSPGGGYRGWELSAALIPTRSCQPTSWVLSRHRNLDGAHVFWVNSWRLAHFHRGFGEGREEVHQVFFTGMKYAPKVLLARPCCAPCLPGDTLANRRSHVSLYL